MFAFRNLLDGGDHEKLDYCAGTKSSRMRDGVSILISLANIKGFVPATERSFRFSLRFVVVLRLGTHGGLVRDSLFGFLEFQGAQVPALWQSGYVEAIRG